MKEPVNLVKGTARPADAVTVSPRAIRGAKAKGAVGVTPRLSGRPVGGVPGGKAVARLNFFLIQRGETPSVERVDRRGETGARAMRPAKAGRASSPAAGLVAGFQAFRGQLAASPGRAGAAAPALAAVNVPQAWQPMGPFFMPHGQTYGEGRGSRPPVAGRVSAVAIDPTNDQHILCGSAGGGVWESRDAGRTWSPRTDDQPSLSIGALAFDPSNALRVYAGTGEGDTARSVDQNVRAAGMLVSNDGGTTWSVMAGTTFVGVSFHDLLVDPADANHILAATTNGLYESTDGGANWNRRRASSTWRLSMHPQVPTNSTAGREVLCASVDGVFRSTNGGTTWTAVALPGLPAGFAPKRIAVCYSPSNGSVAYVFAAGPPEVRDPVASTPSRPAKMPKPYLWRRATFGGTFSAIAPPPDLQTGQARYDWFAAVAPNNPGVLYVGGINAHRGVRQTNGTWIWTNISAKASPGESIHPDQHAIAFSPTNPNVVYIGNDGGVYRSPNAGTNWETLNKGLCITEIEFLAQHPVYDAWLLAGTQDNGTIRYEGQQTWYHVQDGDGGDCDVNHEDPAICFHSFWGPYLERSPQGGGWATWEPALNTNEDSLFYPPLEVNGALVARGATNLWLSPNNGEDWRAHTLPGQTGFPSALAVPTTDRVFVGTTTGEIYRFDRSGTTWNATKLTSPAPGFVSDMLAEPSSNDLWCAVNVQGKGRVFHSPDAGTTWSSLSTGLPADIAIHAMESDTAAATTTLFVGTDVGVFRTTDGGGNWAPFGRGLPNVLVKDVLLHPQTRLLRAGTQARGVWEISLDAPTMPDVHIYLRDHAADTGRKLPSDNDVPSPFEMGMNLFWWQSPDIKIDASPFRVPGLDDLDFDVYSDDRSKREGPIEFAVGLKNERPVRGQTVRVYVQVHNRGTAVVHNVAVKVFFIPAGITWPDLPADFWQNFPNNAIPLDSPWQPVAPHRVIPAVDTGRSAVVGFDWLVPQTIGDAVGLLAVISAANDPINATTLNVAALVRSSRYCALRNVAGIDPSPLSGPPTRALAVDVGPGGAGASLDFDRHGRELVRGVVLSKQLGRAAKKAGWKPVKLTKEDAESLTQITDRRPLLKKQLDLATAYHPQARSADLVFTGMPNEGTQPLVLLLQSKGHGSGSIVLRGANHEPFGGLTIVSLASAD